MRLLEKGRFDEAERTLAPLAGDSRRGVIARFRRAECLSRLGRHDEAVAEARAAAAREGGAAAPGLWLAQALAEAGRFAEAAEVASPVQDAWAALARVAANDRADAAHTVERVLEARHAAVYSLALRLAESDRLRSATRWPDLPALWYAHECRSEMQEDGLTEHPPVPRLRNPERPTSGETARAVRWLRFHASCGDWSELVTSLRRAPRPHEGLDATELEMLLALGRVDDAHALAERLAQEAGDDAAGELCIDRTRIAQLRGDAAPPSRFAGFDDARRRLRPFVDWLDLCVALIEDRPLDARALADRISDPSHREYVEAALLRWGGAR